MPGLKTRPKKKNVMKAVKAVQHGLSLRKAEERFKIPKSVIQRHMKDKKMGVPGRLVVLGADVEKMFVKFLVICGESG